ncbi:fibroblast growth factor 2 [Manis pentadactyla]|nr:fibroblast growth factor 2 [Manis pentadactyla]
MHFITQSAPDIRHKLKKAEDGPQAPLGDLVDMAFKVFHAQEDESKRRSAARMAEQTHAITAALRPARGDCQVSLKIDSNLWALAFGEVKKGTGHGSAPTNHADRRDHAAAVGLLVPTNSPCNTPILPVKKPSGEYRLVQDVRIIYEAVIPLHPERGFLTTKGTPIINGRSISHLLQVLQDPKEVAIMHCKGHQTGNDPVTRGWIEAFPTSQETALVVAQKLVAHIIPHFGLPALLQLDNGPAFVSRVTQLTAETLNITWNLHIPYHPQLSVLPEAMDMSDQIIDPLKPGGFQKNGHNPATALRERKTKRGLGGEGLGWAPSGERAGVEPLGLRRPGTQPPRSPRPELWSRACVLRSKRPTQRPAPENPERGGGGAQEGRRAGGVGGWVLGAGDVDATPRSAGGRPVDAVPRWHPDRGHRSLGTRPSRESQPRRQPALNPSSPASRLPTLQSRRGGQRPSGASGARLGASGRGRAPRGGRLGGRGRGRSPERLGGRGRGRGSAAPRAAAGARGPRQGPGGAMAAGSITTLPALPEDGGSGAFPPGHFKDPKRLYCKNGGFFLRIHPDGRVDGVREKSDPHIKLQLQAEERGVVSIKGVCANRYLAMKEDGRLLASKCVTDECFFFERLESNNYNTYRSRKYSSWYVALKRTGQYKLGPKTGPGQKAILFLPMSAKS